MAILFLFIASLGLQKVRFYVLFYRAQIKVQHKMCSFAVWEVLIFSFLVSLVWIISKVSISSVICGRAYSTFDLPSHQVSITILDENDNSPEFDITSDTSVDIPENTPMGKKVAVVLGRDKDAGLNGLVRTKCWKVDSHRWWNFSLHNVFMLLHHVWHLNITNFLLQ